MRSSSISHQNATLPVAFDTPATGPRSVENGDVSYSKILVPLDGSSLAERVLPYVRALGIAYGTPVELLRVFGPAPQGLADPAHGLYQHQIDASLHADARDYLDSVKRSIDGPELTVTSTVEEGDPASWIVDKAEKELGTIIAMSTHGRSGIARSLLGSVTDKVMHATNSPLMVVGSRDEQVPVFEVEFKQVIVPLDGSKLAESVLPHVITLAKSLNLTALLVKVTCRREEAESKDYLLEVGEKLHQQGVSSIENVTLHGSPPEAIVDIGRQIQNSLVAMTTHGRSGIKRWLLGSVTDRVVKESGDPVLIVRPYS